MVAITNEKELGKALKNNQDTIDIEGSLTKRVIRIRATGKVCWAIAIGGIGVSVTAIIFAPATGGISTTASYMAAPTTVGVLGGATAVSAVTIAVAAGGVAALNRLRKYKEVSRKNDRIVLKRK